MGGAHLQTTAIRIHRHGGVDVLDYEIVSVRDPAAHEVRIRQEAIGINFADVYQRVGQAGPHDTTAFPVTLGSNGAGVVEAIGSQVEDLEVGQRVGFIHPGAYATLVVVPAARAVQIPASVPTDLCAATLLRGLTAEYLLRRLFAIQPGQAMLVHAAAGGMGTLLSQWGKALGAYVIGTVGSEAKRATATASGCDAVIDYSNDDFVARTRELTNGRGVDVVYDAVGRSVFVASLQCLKPMGMAITYGAASGPVGPFDIQLLHSQSLIVTRPTLRTYIATAEALRRSAAAYFEAMAQRHVRPVIARRYAWQQIREAHSDLQLRRTTGASVLMAASSAEELPGRRLP
jgi:NADPH:quinone reductase